jgi:UDP-N-acetylmuramate dehydrogenase
MKTLIPNTFGLEVYAKKVVAANDVTELCQYWQQAQALNLPVLILGQGSNTLLTGDFDGMVIVNRIKGITFRDVGNDYLFHVGAGEVWHDFVTHTVMSGYNGLENLALIPGCIGSAVIQNIGAYGVEFQKFADYVEVVELATGKISIITDGQYGYRDSIFKHQYRDGYAVVYVGVRLTKQWQPILSYGDLQKLDADTVNAKDIYQRICQIRHQKLPDPAVIGNGGSFFKNPVVSITQAQRITATYPNLPCYPQANGEVKLAAGWLIDQCGLKGYQLGGAAVHTEQALVLINKAKATADNVVRLAAFVRQKVADKFGVVLEPEIRFIGRLGEQDATQVLNQVKGEK